MGQDLAIFTIYTKRWLFINLIDTLSEGERERLDDKVTNI
jgi:hypothetical protein